MSDLFNKRRPPAPPLPRSWRRAIQRLDHALEQNAPADYRELIEIFGRQHFGALWDARPRDDKHNQK